MSDPALYLRAAEELRRNSAQWQAYESTDNCVLLAGPGSGKTKTLTVKLARMLCEDVDAPRGIACITFNNECARELEHRLDALGVESGGRVFIGTVHSFSLTQILMPYARPAGLGLAADFAVATLNQRRGALERAHARVVGGSGNPEDRRFMMDRYRRAFVDRSDPKWSTTNAELSKLADAYEAELRSRDLIDYEDMPLLAVRAMVENDWLRRALVAKYPILAVDEYQDLGTALHRMVMGLCFGSGAGMRLLAVGDVDQSIYGFTGANPELLRRLSQRSDVEAIRLGLNYRSGSQIVAASEYALGETRGYQAAEDAPEGTIYFHARPGNYASQARYVMDTLLPEIMTRCPDTPLGEIAILYSVAWLGDELTNAAENAGFGVIRSDNRALYPRSSPILRWLEQCAIWCCDGWRAGQPRMGKLVSEGARIFRETVADEDQKLAFQRELVEWLWASRDEALDLHDWLEDMRRELIAPRVQKSRSLHDDYDLLLTFVDRLGPTGDTTMTIGEFAGLGRGRDSLNLSTLHSAKGREFDVVILFAMNEGVVPRSNATDRDIVESRRLFYVGFTRARHEVHLMYSQAVPSRFVSEVSARLAEASAE